MPQANQEPKPRHPVERRVDTEPLLKTNSSAVAVNGPSLSPAREQPQNARRLLSLSVFADSLVDSLIAIASSYFIIFAALVYSRRDQPVDRPGNQALLQAAKYNPTLFPVLFAAIVAKFLRAIASVKLENGASVLLLEYLLQSRTVFSSIMAPLTLKSVNALTPFLFLLWALSPLGGQAGLRVIYTQESFTNKTQNFTYLAFVSPFTNGGVTSASAEPLVPINAIFTASLISSAKTKNLPQDQFSNVKIPIYENLPSSQEGNDSDWRSVPGSGDLQWSSLTGLPVHNLPSSGISLFTMNTAYMVTTCIVSGQNWEKGNRQSLEEFQGWSGANYALTPGLITPYAPANFTFRSLDLYSDGDSTDNLLTVANCNVTMDYVEVQIKCNGQVCQSVAARPSKSPAMHKPTYSITNLSPTYYTPVNGLGQRDITYTYFFKDLTNATNPTVGCDTTFCPPSVIEGYLVNPTNPLSQTHTSKIWEIGNKLVSQRFTQLINTYWIDSIAPFAVSGNFTLAYSDFSTTSQYNTDSTIGTIMTNETVIKCDYKWFAIMLICSLVLFMAGLATVVLTACRRGPDVLDRFSSLLRDNPYAEIPQKSSMEDALDQSKRLGNLRVRIGDVCPEEDVGYVAIGTLDGNYAVRKLSPRRKYA